MPRIGIVLSGCGVYDGSEIHEAVLSMYYLKKYGNELLIMAPNVDQAHVVNHLTGEVEQGQKRNVLVESARIARGNITDISKVTVDDFDALLFPGGFGAAKNLVSFAFDGAKCSINPDVKRLIKATVDAKKPLAAVCIAPVVVAKALEDSGIKAKLTIGNEEATANAINAMGAEHIESPVKEVIIDAHHNIITNPAYMLAADIAEVGEAIKKTMQALTGMVNNLTAGC